MTLQRVQGLLFVLFGIISSYDSWRIIATVRPTANFDAIGPDRYLLFLSALMIVVGLLLALRPSGGSASFDWSDLRKWPPANYLVVIAIMVAFVWGMSYLGFTIACLAFFVAAYRLLGDWSWSRTIGYAAITTVFIYVVFVYFSDMSLPKSFLGI